MLLAIAAVGGVFAGYTYYANTQAWRAALRKQGFFGEMPALTPRDRLLIFAPHPDDEALGCGGLIQQALARHAQVDVVLVTNGDASEMALIFGERDMFVSPQAMIGLGKVRQEESVRALARLGLPAAHLHFLGYPNNGLTQLWQPDHWRPKDKYASPTTHVSASPYPKSLTPRAAYCGQQVLSDMLSLLEQVRPTKVFFPHPKDIHPDHWATSCFVQYAMATALARGKDWAATAEQYGYLIHWPRFPEPARCALGLDLLPPGDLSGPDTSWLRLDLTAAMTRRKFQALRSYSSQVPRLDPFLCRFARSNETFEQVRPRAWNLNGPTVWTDRGIHRRGTVGLGVDRVELSLAPGGKLPLCW